MFFENLCEWTPNILDKIIWILFSFTVQTFTEWFFLQIVPNTNSITSKNLNYNVPFFGLWSLTSISFHSVLPVNVFFVFINLYNFLNTTFFQCLSVLLTSLMFSISVTQPKTSFKLLSYSLTNSLNILGDISSF